MMAKTTTTPLKVVIVGCGLGGLVCAISCRREGLDVVILEKTAELSEIGAGIQLPPNATRVVTAFGLSHKLDQTAGKAHRYLRWQDGSEICEMPGADWQLRRFGEQWHTIHRADYQRILADEARRLGVQIRLDCDVVKVECNETNPKVILANRESMVADVVVGADGLHSIVRANVLGRKHPPKSLGYLAYRITIPREDLVHEDNATIDRVISGASGTAWWGGDMHAVMYAIRGLQIVNLVLIVPDSLPADVAKQPGDLEEMRKLFEDWDPTLRMCLSKVKKALKWKIWGLDEIDKWTSGAVTLIGDACHPGSPHAASGAAVAIEDGAVLGRLLGNFDRSDNPKSSLPALMLLFQNLRKRRTTSVVELANANKEMFSMPDGPQQQERDRLFKERDWDGEPDFPYKFGDLSCWDDLFTYDCFKSADTAFAASEFAGRRIDKSLTCNGTT